MEIPPLTVCFTQVREEPQQNFNLLNEATAEPRHLFAAAKGCL